MSAAVPSGISGDVLIRGAATAGCSAFSSRSDVGFAMAMATSHKLVARHRTTIGAQFSLKKAIILSLGGEGKGKLLA